ncbi:ribonuclease III domain-containing protein [Moorella naiadis]|uniref:Mini-ribonuclease 3 n=1 Tax=Moorella naiadis (nom. illeg.) TaxID=3093670 RepID=UPI003D9C8B62
MDPTADLSPLVLAYIGDAVYELLVRTYLVRQGPARPEQLHREAMKYVRATAQARLVPVLEEYLTPAERDILRRGRNARPGHLPRTTAPAEYHFSTALESLLGYLYLQGNNARLAEIGSLLFTLAGKEGKTDNAD